MNAAPRIVLIMPRRGFQDFQSYNTRMFQRRKFRLPLTWALLFAVLVNLMAPQLATARVPAKHHGLGEICSASRAKFGVAGVANGTQRESGGLLHDGHCKHCSFAVAIDLPPVAAATLPMEVGLAEHAPPRAPPVDAMRPDCPPPQSHAPPFLS